MVAPYILPDVFVGHDYQLALYFELRVCEVSNYLLLLLYYELGL
jgi:hypothetical protein